MAYIAGYNPVFTRPEGWESMTHQQLWEKVAYHSYTYELEFDRPAGRAEQGTEQAELLQRTVQAFDQLYPESDRTSGP